MAAGGHTSGDAVAGVTMAFTIVAVLGTVLRLYTRISLNGMGGADDVFIAFATVSRGTDVITIVSDNIYRF